jgi:hypothetical protein
MTNKKLTDRELLDFVGEHVVGMYYGYLSRGRYGWTILMANEKLYTHPGNGPSFPAALRKARRLYLKALGVEVAG